MGCDFQPSGDTYFYPDIQGMLKLEPVRADVSLVFPARDDPEPVLKDYDFALLASWLLKPEFSGFVLSVTLYFPGTTPGLGVETKTGHTTVLPTGKLETSARKEFVRLVNVALRRSLRKDE